MNSVSHYDDSVEYRDDNDYNDSNGDDDNVHWLLGGSYYVSR